MLRTRRLLAAALIVLPAALTACGGNPLAGLTGGGDCPGISKPVASGPGSFDGGDGKTTTQKGPLQLDGKGCDGTIPDTNSADNWTFEAKANETIIISVDAKGDSDPDLTVIDPNGDVFDANDDSGIGNSTSSLLNTTLDSDGVYTLRVDAYTPGGYTITVKSGTPEP